MPRSVSPEKRDQALEYYMRAVARVADRARPATVLPDLTPVDFKLMVHRMRAKIEQRKQEGKK